MNGDSLDKHTAEINALNEWKRSFDEWKDELFKQVVRLNTCYEERTEPELKRMTRMIEKLASKCQEIKDEHVKCSSRTTQTLKRIDNIQSGCFHCGHPEDAGTLSDRVGVLETKSAVNEEKSKGYYIGLSLLGGMVPVILVFAGFFINHLIKGGGMP